MKLTPNVADPAAVAVPIVGMGGVSSGADARKFIAVGATLVAVDTESFRDPRAGRRVAEELSSGQAEQSAGLPS